MASLKNLWETLCWHSLLMSSRKALLDMPCVLKQAASLLGVSVASLRLPSAMFSVFRDFLLDGLVGRRRNNQAGWGNAARSLNNRK